MSFEWCEWDESLCMSLMGGDERVYTIFLQPSMK